MEDNNRQTQANNPLHGVKLIDMLEYLHAVYGWKELGDRIQIRCFQSNPSIKSSLKFLRNFKLDLIDGLDWKQRICILSPNSFQP